jgi:hypothetical protein
VGIVRLGTRELGATELVCLFVCFCRAEERFLLLCFHGGNNDTTFEMIFRVALVRNDVSKEHIASIFRVMRLLSLPSSQRGHASQRMAKRSSGKGTSTVGFILYRGGDIILRNVESY